MHTCMDPPQSASVLNPSCLSLGLGPPAPFSGAAINLAAAPSCGVRAPPLGTLSGADISKVQDDEVRCADQHAKARGGGGHRMSLHVKHRPGDEVHCVD